MANPVVRHGSTIVSLNSQRIRVRILLIKYDGCIETYFQDGDYPYQFAYGLSDCIGFRDAMQIAINNAETWGFNHENF